MKFITILTVFSILSHLTMTRNDENSHLSHSRQLNHSSAHFAITKFQMSKNVLALMYTFYHAHIARHSARKFRSWLRRKVFISIYFPLHTNPDIRWVEEGRAELVITNFNFIKKCGEGQNSNPKPFKVHVDINMLTRTMHINSSISVHFHNVTFIGLAACVQSLSRAYNFFSRPKTPNDREKQTRAMSTLKI